MWFYILFSFLSKFFKWNIYMYTHTHKLMKFFVIINGYMNIMGCPVLS